MILSLAMANTPYSRLTPSGNGNSGGLMLMLIDPKGHSFSPFAGLPHLARSVIKDLDEAAEALTSLVRLMEKRGAIARSGTVTQPHIVVVIDELADMMMIGGKVIEHALTRLTQRGREAGIHVVAATQKPTAAVLGPLIKANFPVRLVGRVTCAADARTATGWSGTGAERLMGRGDFLAVAEGRVIHFQVAHVAIDEIQEVVTCLAQEKPLLPPATWPWPINRLTEVFRGA
jgi:S-DNA-T family DNA segregation ATPase FtsK/SpoIIIE